MNIVITRAFDESGENLGGVIHRDTQQAKENAQVRLADYVLDDIAEFETRPLLEFLSDDDDLVGPEEI